MSTPRRLAVVSAGLRQPSSTRLLADRLAAATTAAAGERGLTVESQVIEVRDHAHDLTNALLNGFAAPALQESLDAVAAADAVIAVSPIFNASFSGLFKSFFDVLDGEALIDKPVLIGATGGTPRHSMALDHALRPMFAHLRAVVIPTAVYAATEDWGALDGAPAATPVAPATPVARAPHPAEVHEGLDRRIRRGAGELAGVLGTREPVRVTDPFEAPTPFAELFAATRPQAG